MSRSAACRALRQDSRKPGRAHPSFEVTEITSVTAFFRSQW